MSTDAETAALVKGLETYCPKRCRESDARCFSFPGELCDGIPARDALDEAERLGNRKLDGKMHEDFPT